jgi:hypothetical protein
MKKQELGEDLLRLIEHGDAAVQQPSRALAIVESVREKVVEAPPPALWQAIQSNIAAGATAPTLYQRLKDFLATPAAPVFAVALVAIIGGAFFLLNRATIPAQVPLVEITAVIPQKAGSVIVAQGLRIESTSGGNIERVTGATDKIVMHTGNWSVALRHAELQQRTQFVFPGGALEPLGTAFTLEISADGTAVNLTEGKIRLMEYEASRKAWRTREVVAPFSGVVAKQVIERDVPEATQNLQDKAKPLSRYARLKGKLVAVELKNGDRLSGRVSSALPEKIILESSAGKMTVRESDILHIQAN